MGHHSQGISVKTLVIASISSAAAALLTSLFWESGTVFSAAVTPVLVTLLGQALAKPAEAVSRVRPTRFVSSAAASRTPVGTPAGRGADGAPEREARPSGNGGDPRAAGRPSASGQTAGGPAGGGAPRAAGGYRRYGRRWRPDYRVALVTAGVAFLIAASVLTVPELLFGQSIAGQNGRTTLGGGSSRDKAEESQGTSSDSTTTSPGQEAGAAKTRPTPEVQPGQADPAAPQATPPTPTSTTPAPSTGSGAPESSTPQPTSPAPSQPKFQP